MTHSSDIEPVAAVRTQLVAVWTLLATVMLAACALATWMSPRFGYDHAVIDMPALALTIGLCAAGLVFALGVPALVRRTLSASPAAGRSHRTFLAIIVAGGLAARLALIPSVPMLEDDYQRYLWDGAVTAAGLNPYAVSPRSADEDTTGSTIGQLAKASAPVVERIGHAGLKTIYPPVAQGTFALAHALKPWSLTGWKFVVLAADICVLALILLLLAETSRSPLWAALYWWNPLVLKELFNSAHMEPVVMALVLLALLLAVRGRMLGAVAALGFAAGAKLWPVLLLPMIARPLLADLRRLTLAIALFTCLMALWAWPILAGGLDATSGFVAYAANWRTNSALFPTLDTALTPVLTLLGASADWGGRAARALLALAAVTLALALARKPLTDGYDLVCRAAWLAAAVMLLSPAQYPWYALWFLPLLPFLPLRTFLVLTVTLPIYYAFFHFNARDNPDVFRHVVVWAIWLPAWAALWIDLRAALRPHSPDRLATRAPA